MGLSEHDRERERLVATRSPTLDRGVCVDSAEIDTDDDGFGGAVIDCGGSHPLVKMNRPAPTNAFVFMVIAVPELVPATNFFIKILSSGASGGCISISSLNTFVSCHLDRAIANRVQEKLCPCGPIGTRLTAIRLKRGETEERRIAELKTGATLRDTPQLCVLRV
ncbi:hypothetical protein Pla52o_30030 [Novipirellula galeiformis]|uniref:Uncharacterized protein n=1 Tax=Novipirellula galeiformis TaxID=2528004 RepID=A0A5C6CIG8_9BACT|nr:hypothetical protein Pla52o_30030 [Novipirellula galeiformis]